MVPLLENTNQCPIDRVWLFNVPIGFCPNPVKTNQSRLASAPLVVPSWISSSNYVDTFCASNRTPNCEYYRKHNKPHLGRASTTWRRTTVDRPVAKQCNNVDDDGFAPITYSITRCNNHRTTDWLHIAKKSTSKGDNSGRLICVAYMISYAKRKKKLVTVW